VTSIVETIDRLGECLAEARTAPPWLGLSKEERALRVKHDNAAFKVLRARWSDAERANIADDDFSWDFISDAWPEPKVGDRMEGEYSDIHEAIRAATAAYDADEYEAAEAGYPYPSPGGVATLCAVYDSTVFYTFTYRIPPMDRDEFADFCAKEAA
jgi:hypothetical protein